MGTLNKFHKDKFFTKIQHNASASGVIGLAQYEVFGENILRVVTDFTSSGILTVEARIKHSKTWENLGTLLADGDSEEFDIGSYDYIRFNFTTPSGSSGQVGVSGFFKGSAAASRAGFNLIQPDVGTAPVSDTTNSILNLTSSDGSILVEGDSNTDTINLTTTESSAEYLELISKNTERIDDIVGSIDDQYVSFGALQINNFKGVKGQWSYYDKRYYKCIATNTWLITASEEIVDDKIANIFTNFVNQYVPCCLVPNNSANGLKGQWSFQVGHSSHKGYVKICIATNTWVRFEVDTLF